MVWCVGQRLNTRLESFARSLADHLLANSPLSIDDIRRWQRRRRKLRTYIAPAQNDLIALRNIFLKLLNKISSVVVRDANYTEPARIQILLHCAERRNLRATGNAPRRPKIQQHHAAAKIFQAQGTAIQFGE